MQESSFARWLANDYVTRSGGSLGAAPQHDAVSRCRRVERYEGDLHAHYSRDRMKHLIGKFEYSTDDERNHIPPAHSVPISGDIRTGTASLKSALILYRSFLESRPTASMRR
jgi:hypothetical protein